MEQQELQTKSFMQGTFQSYLFFFYFQHSFETVKAAFQTVQYSRSK